MHADRPDLPAPVRNVCGMPGCGRAPPWASAGLCNACLDLVYQRREQMEREESEDVDA